MDWFDPRVFVEVVDDEVAVELPVGPRPSARFRGACDGGGIGDARFERRLVVSAELAEVDGSIVLLAPRLNVIEVPVELRALLGRTPGDSELLVLRCPIRALMRERH